MSNHAPKVDLVSKLFFVGSLLAILAVVYVLVSSLINTYNRNSTKGELDNTMKVAAVADNLKPVGASATSDAPIAGAAGRPGKELYAAVCQACHAAGVLEAPKLGDKAAWEARAANGLDGLIKTATDGKGSMPAKGGDPSITDSELKEVILYMTKESGLDLGGAEEPKVEAAPAAKEPVAKEAPKAEPAKEVVAEVAKEEPKVETVVAKVEAPKAEPVKVVEAVEAVVEKAVEVAPVAVAAVAPSADGKKVYDTACFACHATGVANSPILGNKEAWAPRIAQGMDVLYATSLKGKGAMPPKGGNLNLEDAKVKAAVDYMVSKAQ